MSGWASRTFFESYELSRTKAELLEAREGRQQLQGEMQQLNASRARREENSTAIATQFSEEIMTYVRKNIATEWEPEFQDLIVVSGIRQLLFNGEKATFLAPQGKILKLSVENSAESISLAFEEDNYDLIRESILETGNAISETDLAQIYTELTVYGVSSFEYTSEGSRFELYLTMHPDFGIGYYTVSH